MELPFLVRRHTRRGLAEIHVPALAAPAGSDPKARGDGGLDHGPASTLLLFSTGAFGLAAGPVP